MKAGQLRRSEIDRGLLAIAAGLDVVRQALLLVQRLHAGRLDRADVDEAVFTAALRRDETITLVGIEKLDGAARHDAFLSGNDFDPAATCDRGSARGRL